MPAVGVHVNGLSFFIGKFREDETRIQELTTMSQAKGSAF